MRVMEVTAKDRILDYTKGRTNEMQEFLQELVLAESPSTSAQAQLEVMRLLTGKLKKQGLRVAHFPGKETGGYLLCHPEYRIKNLPLQLLIGHCDTVWPMGTIEAMPVKHENGTMRGPGVYDMKAGLTQIVFALEALNRLGLSPHVTPVVLINSDEEIGSNESLRAIERLARIANRAYVLEPPLGLDGKLKTARKGIGRFTITVKGRSAHAGLDPGKGASAIVELSHQIQRLYAMNNHERGITVNVGMIEGGISPNMVAPESKAVVDVRVRFQEDAERIEHNLRALEPVNPDTEIHVEGVFGRPPMERTRRNQKLWRAAQRAGRQLGIALDQATAGGGSDGNTTSLYCATLDGLGTVGDGAHAHHEFIYVDQLAERTALLAMLLMLPPL